MKKTLLSLNDIKLEINNNIILENISFDLKKGEIITLVGPNGGGKTSIAKIILGILEKTSGKIKKHSKFTIGYMPQKIKINPTIPITAIDFLHLSNKKIKFNDNLENLLSRFNLEKLLKKQVHDLSGGQMQKLLFLRSIINSPDLLILDEPTQYMDISAINEFYDIIEEIKKLQNCSILLISHDLNIVMKKSDFVICLNKHICCHGAPNDINKHPEYISLFGNKSSIGIYQHHHNHKH